MITSQKGAFSGAGLLASSGRLFVVDREVLSAFGDCFPGFGDGAARTVRQAHVRLCDLGEGQLSRLDPSRDPALSAVRWRRS